MPIQMRWHDSHKKIVALRVEGSWTWRDYQDAMTEMHAMMDTSPHEKVDFIMDMSLSTLIPRDMMNRMKRHERHPKAHKMVVVGAGIFAQTLFNLMEFAAPDMMNRIKLCKNMEEALSFLDKPESSGA